jgi:hypothetical protein
MQSPNGFYKLVFWADGNGTLAGLYDTKGNKIWSWGRLTANYKAAVNTYLAENGTIGIYRQSDHYYYGSFGNAGPVDATHAYTLNVEDDGKVVVYPVINGVASGDPLWSSGW